MNRASLPYPQLLRLFAALVVGGYALIMTGLFREDLRLATIGDALDLKRREVDAQLDQNMAEIQKGKKAHDDLLFLRDERRALNAQGIQVSREIDAWQSRRDLWSPIYWTGFAFAHLCILPLAFWAWAAAHGGDPMTNRGRPGRQPAGPRKRSPRSRSTATPKLVEGSGS